MTTTPATGGAAMLLLFDIAPEAVAEHDDWHTHEHLPERLSIPGFRHGSRWVAPGSTPAYLVVYDVDDLSVLTSTAYLARLNDPTPWTAKMMRSYVGMRRALCNVVAAHGAGIGTTALLVRYAVQAGEAPALQSWLDGSALPELARRRGIVSARRFVASAAAPMTREQQIRGPDASFDSAVLVTGYEAGAIAALARDEFACARFEARGVPTAQFASGVYRLAVALGAGELARRGAR
jgi:uncharacterized RDD family membrane protein YckC